MSDGRKHLSPAQYGGAPHGRLYHSRLLEYAIAPGLKEVSDEIH
jgi:hypothetical protein